MRTLIVSPPTKEKKNHNPVIKSISFLRTKTDTEGVPVVFTGPADTPPDPALSPAAAAPYRYDLTRDEFPIWIKVEAYDEDETDPAALKKALRYQWVTVKLPAGGRFKSTRREVQEFEPPFFLLPEPAPGACRPHDHRCDTNLYPIWVIVRDIGAENSLGNNWAEFYIRVVPPGQGSREQPETSDGEADGFEIEAADAAETEVDGDQGEGESGEENP